MNSQLLLKHKEAVAACFAATRTQNTDAPVCPNWLERSAVSAGVRVPLQEAAVIPAADDGSRTQAQTSKKDYRNETQPSKDSITWRTLLFWAVEACSRCWTGSTWVYKKSLSKKESFSCEGVLKDVRGTMNYLTGNFRLEGINFSIL